MPEFQDTVSASSLLIASSGLPLSWTPGERAGVYRASGVGTRRPVIATVEVYEPLASNPDYLLERFATESVGPLGRPQVQALPNPLADGVSIVAFAERADGSLVARVDLVRRAWNLDIIVSAATLEVEALDQIFSAMLDLLATVRPEEEEDNR